MPRCQAPGSEDKKRQRRQQITGTHSIFVPRSGRLLDIKEELGTLEIPRASLSVVPVGLGFASGPDSSRSVDGEFRKKHVFGLQSSHRVGASAVCLGFHVRSFLPPGCIQTTWRSGYHVWWDEVMKDAPDECEPEWLDAEDPLFILYTSGSTGKPKVRRRCSKLTFKCRSFTPLTSPEPPRMTAALWPVPVRRASSTRLPVTCSTRR